VKHTKLSLNTTLKWKISLSTWAINHLVSTI